MLDNNAFNPDKLSILEYKLIKGQIDTPEDLVVDHIEGYNLDNTLQLSFNLEEKLIKADFKVDIRTDSKGKNPNEALGVFHLAFIFRIENLDKLVILNKKNVVELHPHLGNALSSITYSTTRGILMIKVQGTALQNFILPIINPNKLLIK